jgi:hypothetical protein
MKCIKSIKASKTIEVGVIQRVDDVEAEARVKSTYWVYIPKSEWKAAQSKVEEPKVAVVAQEGTISEKQLKRKKNEQNRSK